MCLSSKAINFQFRCDLTSEELLHCISRVRVLYVRFDEYECDECGQIRFDTGLSARRVSASSGDFCARAAAPAVRRRGAALAMCASAEAANAELDWDRLVLTSTKPIAWGDHVRARCAPRHRASQHNRVS